MTITKGSEQGHPYRMPARIMLATALAAQIVWTAWQLMTVGFAFDVLWRPLAFTAVFILVAVTRGTVRLINALGRVTIASAFLWALWDRFNNFSRFIRYAGRVLSFMPAGVVPTLAVIATACEVGLCVAMFFGFKTRWASAGSAILLFMFATSMVISGLSQFGWAVYVLATGAFVLATVDATLLSIDSITFNKEESWKSPVATH
jgi:putative oxidoreductase